MASPGATRGPVLLFGATGWLGGLLCEEVKARGLEVAAARSRGEDAEAVEAEVRAAAPRLVLSALGRTHGSQGGTAYATVDYLELPGMLPVNLRDNLLAPLLLARVCQRLGVPCAILSTGCIYSGGGPAGFPEDAPPNFQGSAYSCVKAAADQLLRAFCADSALWFRVRLPLSRVPHPRNTLSKLLRYQHIHSSPNAMSVVDGPDGLLGLFLDLALAGHTGCFNGCNPGALTQDEVLQRYRARVDPAFAWTMKEGDGTRSQCELSSERLAGAAARLGRHLPPLPEALDELLEAWPRPAALRSL